MSYLQRIRASSRLMRPPICAALALTAALCTSQAVRAQETITFGAALSLTGKMATESAEVQKGYDFYVRHINELGGIKLGDHKVKVAIKYYDDESNPATSAKLYERMINEDGIKLLLGPYSSGVTMAVTAVTEKYKMPIVVAHAAAGGRDAVPVLRASEPRVGQDEDVPHVGAHSSAVRRQAMC